jgi:hypothetical protein
VTAFSITFASDASVKAGSVKIGNGSSTPLTPTELLSPIAIRLYTVREATDDEVDKGTCFIEITPLTGVFQSYGFQEAATSDLLHGTSK